MTVSLIDYDISVETDGASLSVRLPGGAVLTLNNGVINATLPSGDAISFASSVATFAPAFPGKSTYEFNLEDGSAQASRHFLWAAACFRQLRTAFAPILGDPITADLSLTVVSALEKLMEAEASELWLRQAEVKGLKIYKTL